MAPWVVDSGGLDGLTARSADSPRSASPLDFRGVARHRTVAWLSSAWPSEVDRIAVLS